MIKLNCCCKYCLEDSLNHLQILEWDIKNREYRISMINEKEKTENYIILDIKNIKKLNKYLDKIIKGKINEQN